MHGTWMGLEEGNLGHWTWYYSCASLVTELSIQHNSKLDIKVQSLIRVKVYGAKRVFKKFMLEKCNFFPN